MKQKKINKIENIITEFIKKYTINKILIAISGGQDSICLIQTIKNLNIIKNKKKTKISYIYIDHQWKKSGDQQIKHLINYIKLIQSHINIYQINKIALSEDKCRQNRYHIIIKHAILYNYNLIITGHNETDKIETFIQSIIKGSGVEYINNLAIKSKIYKEKFILRPLIGLDRNYIYWLCKKLCLPIWSDNTNYIYTIQRNRIRQELIPYIKQYLHVNVEKNIQYLLNNQYYQNEYLKQSTIKLYLKIRHSKRIAIDYNLINKQNFILQIKVIQIFCFHNIQIYLENKKVIKIIRTINKTKLSKLKIAENKYFNFFISNNWFYISIKNKNVILKFI
uniref:tRNA(Ile)-lysidine synthase, chloroplastic n=1 Tax=Herposiphonia versicolor TaxID=2007163 RepID=A0A1Z1MG38_9FLOR|nr:tRNA Ile-lysidine synthetase [Herposiphonia versicolor]ARW64714.1 tRNA Ile-lysidine synthetase [Herposiphonia versicolor]